MLQYKTEAEDARKTLKKMLKSGDTVYTTLKHVSGSGMQRTIAVLVVKRNRFTRQNQILNISYKVSQVTGFRYDSDRAGVKVSGSGMDMGFHVVYTLGEMLFPHGHPCTGKDTGKNRCTSNDHSNGDRDYTKGKRHSDGGYAFEQVWI